MMKYLFFTVVVLFLGISNGVAQEYYGKEAADKVEGCHVVRYSSQSNAPAYLSLQNPTGVSQNEAMNWMRTHLQASNNDIWTSIRSEKDEIGYVHERFQQHYNGFPVEGGVYLTHCKEGYLQSVNGVFFNNINVNVTPSLNEQTALNKALQFVGAQRYKWEIAAEENHIKTEQNNIQATYFPTGTLVLAPQNGQYASENFQLAYKFNIYAHEPMSRQYVYVNANNGEVIHHLDLIHETDSTASANTKYSGTQSMKTDFVSANSFRLREAARCGIQTYNLQKSTTYSNTDFTDTDNIWNNVNANQDEIATDCHWGAEKTYDFYKNNFNRNSFDNLNSPLLSYVHYSNNYANAFWDGTRMTYGDGGGSSGFTPLTCLDVTGHEITHGVTEFSAGLNYSNESGALNESFSDIFGKSIEKAYKPTTFSWRIGKEITTSGNGIRNMQNPNNFSNPDTYTGTYWYTGTGDNGGVHTNSGVQNYWYYLMCQGGTGTNDLGNAFNVTALGFTKAQAITYRNLTVYLTATSQYADARFYAIQSAIDLYGACSLEHEMTTRAWYAVGVGANYSVGVTANFVANTTTFCSLPATVNFTNTSNNGTTFNWNFGNSTTSTLNNPSATYTANGTYAVKLVADGGLCGKDSVTKTSYITINAPANPTTADVTICNPGSATLNVTPNSSGMIDWFNTSTGGTAFYTGNSYNIPSVTATQTFYVSEYVPTVLQSLGPANNSFGTGGYLNANQFLIFDATKNFTLESVVIYANGAGNRTIELRNSVGAVLQTATVNLANGQQTVTLNFDVPVGTNLQLGLSSTSSSNLYRNNTGPTYPYNIAGLASIKTSSASTNPLNYYYFFYDWKVREKPCRSARVPITVTLGSTPSTPNITQAGNVLSANVVASSYQWYLNGNLISGANAATYTASTSGTYTVIAYNGTCASGTSATFEFTLTSLDNDLVMCASCANIFPNPTRDQITLNIPFAQPANTQIRLVDALGRVVIAQQFNVLQGLQNHTIEMQTLPQGVYIVEVQANQQIIRRSIVKQ